MTEKELVDRIVSLAEETLPNNPMAASILFHLANVILAGPEWLQRSFDATGLLSTERVHHMTGEGETVQ